jgi:MauM/NapG family ferredoxin protein
MLRLRKGVQTLFFALFVLLIWNTAGGKSTAGVPDLFFRLNPLSALSAMLAERAWLPKLALALITVGATLALGRVWCGWICPMGTMLEWFHLKSAAGGKNEPPQTWRSIKYILLLVILVLALLGNLALLVLDPLALISRVMTTAVIPALSDGFTQLEIALYRLPPLEPVVDWLESALRGSVLPTRQPVFTQNLWIAALFTLIIGLNLLRERFWCRYLCPLGGLLGWLSKVAIFRPVVGEACNQCTGCALACRLGAIQATSERIEIHTEECTVCLDCLASCKKDALSFKPRFELAPRREYDPSRRQALAALAAGAGGLLLLRTDLSRTKPDTHLIRPPGGQDEDIFLSACLRCSLCMRACPTNALQPAFDQAGLEGLWTPVLIPRQGYCDYGCNQCGQVCPSGAIPNLSLEEKRQAVLGKASVLRDRCLPWASQTPCIVCEEMCPTPQKSIRLEEVHLTNAEGQEIILQRPYVVRELCIGCGICENRCPLEGEAGIRVYGE